MLETAQGDVATNGMLWVDSEREEGGICPQFSPLNTEAFLPFWQAIRQRDFEEALWKFLGFPVAELKKKKKEINHNFVLALVQINLAALHNKTPPTLFSPQTTW